MTIQNLRERIVDRVALGEITAEQANVELVRAERVRLVVNGIPANIRRALNDAVRSVQLAHLKRDGGKPEAYFHPDFAWMARHERNVADEKKRSAVRAVCVGGAV